MAAGLVPAPLQKLEAPVQPRPVVMAAVPRRLGAATALQQPAMAATLRLPEALALPRLPQAVLPQQPMLAVLAPARRLVAGAAVQPAPLQEAEGSAQSRFPIVAGAGLMPSDRGRGLIADAGRNLFPGTPAE
ncbi:hypothetical protein YTPLAS18_34060 [Nitrospira sp.]|nr:hypothetical protein YTPLAS18_34060 [Nitrospira sp.]